MNFRVFGGFLLLWLIMSSLVFTGTALFMLPFTQPELMVAKIVAIATVSSAFGALFTFAFLSRGEK